MALEPRDFPQMWQKPSSDEVLATLRLLEVKPPIWGHKRRLSEIAHEQEATAYFRREVATYLSSIVKSSLAWIEDDDEKDAIWSEASRRLSERCGRAAMGEITRRWPFREDDLSPTFELIIREPPLIGDAVGLKTWGSSYVLAQYLPRLSPTSLFRLFDESLGEPRPTVLELGSGTGLLGLAAAALWKVTVILSDLPEIMPNLQYNIEINRDVIQPLGGSLDSGVLTWGGSSEDEVDQRLFGKANQFRLVLAADALYDDVHPALLAGAFSDHLSHHDDSRAVVMVPHRDETAKKLRDSFREIMAARDAPLICIEEGVLSGEDDWGEQDGEATFECWWGIFARARPAEPMV